eukprot:13154458-Ditylum_brightwellii.AAC.1
MDTTQAETESEEEICMEPNEELKGQEETEQQKRKYRMYNFFNSAKGIGEGSLIKSTNGNNLDLATTDDVFRLHFQNFNGITLNNDSAEFLDEMTILKELGCSLVQAAEGNINWTQGTNYNRAKE